MFSFSQIFKKLYEFFNPNWDFQMAQSLTAFRTFLNGETTIRMWVDDSPGNGHQASTVQILRQLVNPADPDNGFDFSGTIDVYYAKGEEKDLTLPKLYRLIPELRNTPNGRVRNALVNLIVWNPDAPPPLPVVNLGFTGGADDILTGDENPVSPHLANRLQVQYFLRLQPYRWGAPEQIQKLGNNIFIELAQQRVLGGESFNQRAFYIKTPIAQPVWSDYENDAYKTQAEIVQWLTGSAADLGIDFVPIYSIRSGPKVNMELQKPGQERMFEVITAMLASQRNGAIPRDGARPIIVVSCDEFMDKIGESNDGSLTLLVNGGPNSEETSACQSLEQGGFRYMGTFYPSPPDVKARDQEIIKTYEYRKNYCEKIDSAGRVRLVWNPQNLQNVTNEATWLREKNDRVLFLQLGRIPQPLFTYLLQKTQLPPVFEGQGTASFTLNIGHYYFHVGRPGSTSVQYPTSVIGYKEYTSYYVEELGISFFEPLVPTKLQSIANTINTQFQLWPPQDDKNPAEIVGAFIKGYLAEGPDGEYQKYFADVARFYQNPNNDKFRYGVSFLNYIIQKNYEPTTPSSPTLDEASILDQFLGDLKINQGPVDKVLKLIPGALKTGSIFDFFDAFLGKSNPLLIDSSVITPQYDKTEKLSSIIVTGTSKALGEKLGIYILFTAPDGAIVSKFRFTYNQMWAPEELPWIQFSNPFIELNLINAKTLTHGSVGGTIDSAKVEMAIQLPIKEGKWQLLGNFEKPYPTIAKFFQLAGGIDLSQSLPSPFNALSGFGMKSTQLVFNSIAKKIEYVGFLFSTDQTYQLLPGLSLTNLMAKVMVQNPGSVDKRSTEWSLTGIFTLGTGHDAGVVSIGVVSPGLTFYGGLQSGVIKFTDLFNIFLPGVEFNPPSQPTITGFEVSFSVMDTSAYSVVCDLNIDWPITILGTTVFTIDSLGVNVQSQKQKLIAGLTGYFTILPESEHPFSLMLSASYMSIDKSWIFIGQQTSGKISLFETFTFYLPPDWKPDPQFDIQIENLYIQVEPQTNSWQFKAQTAESIKIPGVDLDMDMDVQLGYNGGPGSFGGRETIVGLAQVPVLSQNGSILFMEATPPPPSNGYFGTAKADITWENIDLTVYYDFKPGYKAFGVKWGLLEGKLETTGTAPNTQTKAILKFTESTTIGSMVETMVEWATGSNFGLEAPWNLLNSIPLNNLELEFNFTTKEVGLNVNIGPIEIGLFGVNIATINKITVDYSKAKGVLVTLDGSFQWLGDGAKLPSWDATKPETTPGPPAMGNKYVDIRMLALGQHIEIQGLSSAPSIKKAIELIEKLPDPEPGKTPPVTLEPNNGWLVGLDMGLLRIDPPKQQPLTSEITLVGPPPAKPGEYVFDLKLVFSDPNLYGLAIGLNGTAAKIFQGLKFEIMYRKVTESVGVYQAEIVLPDRMRYIRLGQLNVTLPVFGIEIYTNSDFKVDLGFPWNADFSRSFTFQTIIWAIVPIPITGSIGIYFGKLSSDTSTQLPAFDKSKGMFNPVVVFGFGIQFGLGYDFNIGILSAGFRLTAVAIIEGVIAKWNPYLPEISSGSNDRLEESYYFSLRGTVGFVGKLYGSVDFAIIKASVNIDIKILAQLYFAPYEPIELSITASLTATASIKINLGIFSINIHFSFSISIHQELTLPAIGGKAPWGGDTVHTSLERRYARQRMVRLAHRIEQLPFTTITPQWDNLEAAATPAELKAYLTLGLTMAQDENQEMPTLEAQKACYISMLMLDSVRAPQEDRNSCRIKAADPAQDSAFEIMSKQIFRWVVAAIGTEKVSSEQVDQLPVSYTALDSLLDYLSDPKNPAPIPSAAIEQFMTNQYIMKVQTPEEGDDAHTTCFPMVPSLGFNIPAYGTDPELIYTYATYNSISTEYLNELRKYFDKLAVKAQNQDYHLFDDSLLEQMEALSIASFVFSDYYALVARQMVQMALNSLKNYTYPIQAGDTPAGIVQWINEHGRLSGDETFSIEQLFNNNSSHSLNSAKAIRLEGVTYTVQTAESFRKIITKESFGTVTPKVLAEFNADTKNLIQGGVSITYSEDKKYTSLPGTTLKGIADAVEMQLSDLLDNSNLLDLETLLIPAASIDVPAFYHETVEEDTLTSISVQFGTTVKLMAEAQGNADIIDLFKSAEAPDLNIVQLAQFEVGELLKEIQRTQGLQHLAGLTSRYYMAGLRLITKGITPNYKGMWVTGETGAYALPGKAGLYALTGQQFPIPSLINGTPFEVQFSSTEPWLELVPRSGESGPAGTTTLSIQIADGSTEATQIQKLQEFAKHNYLNTGLTKLGYQPLFDTQPTSYTFHSAVRWASPSTVTMPYPDSAKGLQDLRLWRLPDSLAKLPDLRKHKINPCIKIKLGQYDQATQTLKSEDLTDYGFGSRVEFTIKKVASVSESPATKTTYEVLGADGQNVALLESMLQQIGANNSAIKSLHIAYAQEKNDNGNVSIQTDDPGKLTMGISQVNLSTDTRPPDGSNVAFDLQDLEGIQLNEPTAFIRLLWQAGITRAGGYYLYYFNEESGGGFPDRIFNNEGEAKVSIIVLFSDNDHLLASYMNTVVTSKALNFADYTLFAESVPQTYPIPGSSETLADLVEQYYANIEDLAEAVKDAQLPDKATLSISNGIYEVGLKAPAGNLAQIATHFGTTADAIISANHQITEWPDPLPLYTALFLPELTIIIGTSPGGNSLGAIASFYGLSVGYLAGLNRYVEGLLTHAGGLLFKSGPVEIKPRTPQGALAVDSARAVPLEIPKNPDTTDYAQIFLKNTFSLLAYRVQENQFYNGSSEGLPMSPGTSKHTPLPHGKFGMPPQLTEDDEWEYKIALPYAKFTKASGSAVPHPDDSPYRGLGRLFQVNFNWQDIYGNKLLSTLEHPTESVPLNEPTTLTEYTDQLVSLSQWPSVSTSWEVLKEGEPEQPLLQVLLSFDPTVFDGLWSASIQSENTIMAQFTNELDETSANNLENYELSDGVNIQKIALREDEKSVQITVDSLPAAGNITLQIKDIKSKDTVATYDGTATFTQQGFVTSSLKNQVMASLATYRLLWYQLTDPLGMNLGVQTSLLGDSRLNLSAEQFDQLVCKWLGAIYEFIEKRSQGETATSPTETLHKIQFNLSGLALNTADIFKVETSFIIARKRHDLISNYAYGNDLLSSQTLIAPATTKVDETHSLTDFAKHFEDALSTEEAQLTLATGVDRLQPAASIDGTLWGIRLKKTGTQGIGFEVDSSEPFLFAPKPISNRLISKSSVEICTFTPKTGLDCKNKVQRDFVDIDLDLWCKQLFEAMDHLLSPIFVPSIQLIDHVMSKAYLKGLQEQKEDFADIVKTLMIPIFEGEVADPAIIQERFKQNLLILLANAYNVQAGIQYKAIVQANSTPVPPKLYGNVSQRSPIPQGNISMTSPKLPLEKSDDAPLSFLLSSPEIVRGKDKEVLPYLTLELDYSGSNIEHQIGDVPGIIGYEASSWLKFMNPDSAHLLKAELPVVKVPLPLRAFPISPRMALQDGRLSDDQSVEKLLLWDYKFTYGEAFHYPQDKLHFTVQCNLKKIDARYKDDRLDGETPDLVRAFNEIAQFTTLYPELEKELLKVAKIEAATPKDSPLYTEGEVALDALSRLLKDIIDRSKNGNSMGDAEGEFAGERYSFYLQEGSATIEDVPDVLLISISNDGIVPNGFGKLSVHIDGYETMEYNGCESEKDYCFYFKKRTSSDADQESDLLPASKGQTIPERTISLSGLNILAKQDISASVSIERNPELVPGKPTNTAFVYTTGEVNFPNYYYPNFIHTNPVDIAKLHEGESGKTLKEHLENLFEALLKENSQTELSFSLDSTYDYEVNALHNRMALPIIMQPIKTFTLSDPKKAPAEMILAWATYINLWLGDNKPSKTNGQLNFNLTIFSNLTQDPKPLIQLSNLYLKLADISLA